jgi:hypothetical protein
MPVALTLDPGKGLPSSPPGHLIVFNVKINNDTNEPEESIS